MGAWLSRRGIALWAGVRGLWSYSRSCLYVFSICVKCIYTWTLLVSDLWAGYIWGLVMWCCFWPMLAWIRGKRPSGLFLQESRLVIQRQSVSRAVLWVAKGDVEIVWWKFRVVKPHCHLFLMSSLIIKCVLSFDIVWGEGGGGGDSQPGCWRRLGASLWLHQCACQASGNSFLSPVADKHVSGQCLCSVFLRRLCFHYKVLEWLL